MAATRADRPTPRCAGLRAGLALAIVVAGAAPPFAPLACAQVPRVQPNAPITVDARSSDFDYKNGTLVFRNVRISQGVLAVEADRATATGLEFDDSRWTFEGNVRITTEDGSMKANEARVQFAKNQISTALVTGGPASFEQKRETGVARGRANRIEYDFAKGTVRLGEGAWLSDGKNEITGRTLVYSMRDRRVLATASEQNSERVRITINPQQKPSTAPRAAEPAAKPTP
jgi:lipopolysaccharide export system protein LptA